MQFCSTGFLFCFLPAFLTVYYLFPERMRNIPLVLGSLLFYRLGFDGRWQALLLIGLTLLTFGFGLALGRWGSKALLVLSWGALGAVLIFFKLYEGGSLLPPGLSFYLFQMAAYLAAVYRKTLPAQRSLTEYGAQILMFPKLLSGPLCRPYDLWLQGWGRAHQPEEFHRGLQQLILGIAMKTILADRLGGLWSQAGVIGYDSISTPFAWLALVCWALRLYIDFFAYSIMAVGLGRMLEFDLPRNFRDPYCAKSVSEFYRRWHITLGAWFREYVYIPLGGNRKGKLRTILNLAIVWLLTGLWHGIGWGYLIWAGIILSFILMERLWLGKYLQKCKVFCHIYTPFVILLSWVPFALVNLRDMALFFSKLFGFGTVLNPRDFVSWGLEYLPLILAGTTLCTPWPEKLWHRIRRHPLTDAALFALFWVAMYCLSTGTQDPFLYFQF